MIKTARTTRMEKS